MRGTPDHRTPLTERGRSQASQTGPVVNRAFGTFHYAYLSGYQRTRETRVHWR